MQGLLFYYKSNFFIFKSTQPFSALLRHSLESSAHPGSAFTATLRQFTKLLYAFVTLCLLWSREFDPQTQLPESSKLSGS